MAINFSQHQLPKSFTPAPTQEKGRALSPVDIEAEDKAIKLPKGKFARINPVPGTLAFMFRNIEGGNETIIRYMEVYLNKQRGTSNVSKAIRNFIILWKSFDEFSKRRVDVFDWFCKRYEIDPCRIWGAICEGMFDTNQADIAVELASAKGEVLRSVRRFAKEERNFRDRELIAKATKLINDEPTSINVDARTNVTNNSLTLAGSGFNSIIKKNENLVRGSEVLQLPEATQEFVDAEIVKEKEFQLVED